ncbi:MAG: glucosaminidase domain-containing protein [Bacteroidales bacterium]|nr:glucosaminidase domain-containing protein [Bacteroidales bacterium]
MLFIKNIVIISIIINPFFSLSGFGQNHKLTREEYIEKYKDLAIKEMKRTGIPASITLAQAVLESDNGNSRLARKANNHFGIKCHNNWNGKTIKHSDDRRKECFRKYNSVYESFKDHSDFIKEGDRYKFLFDLKSTDYEAWAKGLQKAGYATSNKYAKRLIKIIEDYKLYEYDNASKKVKKSKKSNQNNKNKLKIDRDVYETNNTKYIIVKEGDTYSNLANKCNMMQWEIYKYNDLPKDAKIIPGQKIYIEPKKNKAERGIDNHIVKQGETMYTISQKYAIKLKNLYKMNDIKPGTFLKNEQKIRLR